MTKARQNLTAESLDLGTKIKQARLEANKSQLQVGVALGVSDKTISGYESNRISPPVSKLLAMCDYFKKPISYFLGTDPKEYKVSSRLRSVEIALKELKSELEELKLYAKNQDLDK